MVVQPRSHLSITIVSHYMVIGKFKADCTNNATNVASFGVVDGGS